MLDLANSQFDAELNEMAIENYQKYLLVFPRNLDARTDMSICFYNIGEYDKALENLKIVLNENPSHQIAMLNTGVVYFSLGDKEQARKWWQKSIDVNEKNEIASKAKNLLEQLN